MVRGPAAPAPGRPGVAARAAASAILPSLLLAGTLLAACGGNASAPRSSGTTGTPPATSATGTTGHGTTTTALPTTTSTSTPATTTTALPAGWSAPDAIAPGESLLSVSCPSTAWCAALGTAAGADYLVVRSGGSWSLPAALPTDLKAAGLGGIDCPAVGSCLAYGQTGDAAWFGAKGWSGATDVDPRANPPADARLAGISCAATDFCVAVDASSVGPPGAAFTWHGSGWSGPVDLPVGLEAVSCPTAAYCAAVALDGQLEELDGSAWHAGPGAPFDEVLALSCTGTTFCMAAGGDHATGDVAAELDGTSWSVAAAPSAAGAAEGFTAVSCAARYCLAIDGGAFANGSAPSTAEAPRAVVWDGTSWGSPLQVDPSNQASAVSCAAPSSCVVVDRSGDVVTES